MADEFMSWIAKAVDSPGGNVIRGNKVIGGGEVEIDPLPVPPAPDPLAFISPEMWRRLEDDAYMLHGILNRAESEDRERLATLSRMFSIAREMLKRRPEEFGGPGELR